MLYILLKSYICMYFRLMLMLHITSYLPLKTNNSCYFVKSPSPVTVTLVSFYNIKQSSMCKNWLKSINSWWYFFTVGVTVTFSLVFDILSQSQSLFDICSSCDFITVTATFVYLSQLWPVIFKEQWQSHRYTNICHL